MADTAARAPFRQPQLKGVAAGNAITLPDSLIKANRKIYIELQTTCADKTNGAVINAFVK